MLITVNLKSSKNCQLIIVIHVFSILTLVKSFVSHVLIFIDDSIYFDLFEKRVLILSDIFAYNFACRGRIEFIYGLYDPGE